jgi:cytoskeletal protein RodZ
MQVSQKTKIPRDFILAIEADDTEQLPAPVYARSYITQLCREYDIDSTPLLNKYAKTLAPRGTPAGHGSAAPAPGPGDAIQMQYRPAIERQVHHGRLLHHVTRYAVLAALLLLVALVLVAFGIQQYKNFRMRHAAQQPPPPTTTSTIDVEEFIIPQQLPLTELPVPEQ